MHNPYAFSESFGMAGFPNHEPFHIEAQPATNPLYTVGLERFRDHEWGLMNLQDLEEMDWFHSESPMHHAFLAELRTSPPFLLIGTLDEDLVNLLRYDTIDWDIGTLHGKEQMDHPRGLPYDF